MAGNITQAELDKIVLQLGVFLGSTPGFRNQTLTHLIASLANWTMGLSKPGDLDFTSIKNGLADPTNPLAEIAPAIETFGGLPIFAAIADSCFTKWDHGSSIPQGSTALVYSLMFLATASVLLRLFARYSVKGERRICLHDVTIVIGLIVTDTLSIFIGTYTQPRGAGRHMWDISFDNITYQALTCYICEHLYGWGIFLIKLSLLLLYWDLFATSTNFNRGLLGVGIFFLLSTVATMTAIIFQCKPVNFWTDLLHMKCFNQWAIYVASSVLNIITDVAMLVLPICIVWKLQMKKRDKISVVFLFGVGAFASIASVVRLKTLNKFAKSDDSTFYEIPTGTWSLVEMDLAIFCSCAPAFRQLLKRFFPGLRIFSTQQSSNTSSIYPSEQNKESSRIKKLGKQRDKDGIVSVSEEEYGIEMWTFADERPLRDIKVHRDFEVTNEAWRV